MNDSEIGKGFKQQVQSAQNPDERIEQNKQDLGLDGKISSGSNSNSEYEAYTPTLEMKGGIGDAVRQGVFEEKQAKLWMEQKQETPTIEAEKPLEQQFKQTAAKPLQASFFDSLSDEQKAQIEAYKQANPASNEEKQSQKKGYGSSDL